MITQLSPLMSRVATQTQPKDLMLQKGSWVYFTPAWPDAVKWARGKLFEVAEEPIFVRYAASYIIPGGDYKNIDLSNATAGLRLYPEDEGVLYECALGFKPGSYITQIYIPSAGKYIFAVRESTMIPDPTDGDKRYLGAFNPEDSPHTGPLLFLHFIKDAPSVILQPYVLEDVTWDKVTFEFGINKCRLKEVPGASEERVQKARRIAYYTELTGY